MIEEETTARYGRREAVWLDTGERFSMVTQEGQPLGPEPNPWILEQWAREHGLEIVSKEMMVHLFNQSRELIRLRFELERRKPWWMLLFGR